MLASIVGSPVSPRTSDLIYQSNLTYIGAFTLPHATYGSSRLGNAACTCCYNPVSGTFYFSGRQTQRSVGEFSVPALVDTETIGNLNIATNTQNFVATNSFSNDTILGLGDIYDGGLTVYDNKVFGTQFIFYDASSQADTCIYNLSALTLSSATQNGLYAIGDNTLNQGFFAGYFIDIPVAYQSVLGGTHFVGQNGLSISARTSSGPAAFAIDLADVGVETPIPFNSCVYYNQANPLNGGYSTSWLQGLSKVHGGVFVPGTKSILFFGMTAGTLADPATGDGYGYGDAVDFNDPYRTNKGYHAQDGDYRWKVWAYNVDDFISVKNGSVNPWAISPYAEWFFDTPFFNGAKPTGAVTYDSANGIIYHMHSQERLVATEYVPVVHAYTVN